MIAAGLLASPALSFAAPPVGVAEPHGEDRLVLLGTKGGPSVYRTDRLPTSQVLVVGGTAYVVDAGYGAVQRLVQAEVPLTSIRYVFLTHLHSDHDLELGTLLYTAWANGLKTPIDVFGPVGVDALTRGTWLANGFDVETRIADEGRPDPRKLVATHEVREGVVFEGAGVKVTALEVHHPPIRHAFAYRFDLPGKVVVFSGDTSYFPALAQFAKGADILVHEAMYGPGIEALARATPNAPRLLAHLKAAHTLAEDVGRIAQAAGVKTLVLSHLVPAFTVTADAWKQAVHATFPGEVVVASDGMIIPLGR